MQHDLMARYAYSTGTARTSLPFIIRQLKNVAAAGTAESNDLHSGVRLALEMAEATLLDIETMMTAGREAA